MWRAAKEDITFMGNFWNRWFSNKTEVIFVVVPDKEFRESEKHFITLSKGVLFNRIDHEYIYRDTDLAIHGRFLDFKPL